MLRIFKALAGFYSSLFRFRVLFAAIILLIWFAAAQNTFAATFTVTRSDDRNNPICDSGVDCSLREAINAASIGFSSDTINFAAGLTLITLADEIEIVPAGSLIISGAGAGILTIDGGAGTNRIFYIKSRNVTISGITMQGGNGGGTLNPGVGGAIYASSGQITLDSVIVKNNGGAALLGGGIALSGGTHHIINSTFSGNNSNKCGGIYAAGFAVYIANSTISGNTATTGINGVSQGAGLCSGGPTIVRNSTITNNSSTGASSQSGGVYNFQLTLDIGNTIVSGNTAINYPEIRNEDTITSAGNNLIGDSASDSTATQNAIAFQASDILDKPPLLGALTILNGGATPTHALLQGSPAIDKGGNLLAVDPFSNSALATDQRGLTRIFDGNADSAATVDIGAFEVQAAPTAADVTIGGRVLTMDGRGILNALVTLTSGNGASRTVRTGKSGYFSFVEITAGETLIINVRAKRFTFAAPTRIIFAAEDSSDINFVALNQNVFGSLR